MGWRTVVVNRNCKLSYKNDYLVIRSENLQMIHLSEINLIIVENGMVSITSYLINELINNKIKLIFCDEKHNPSGEIMPYYGSFNTSKKILKQTKWEDEKKDKVWQQIIKNKIHNQAMILKELKIENYEKRQLRNQLVWSLAHNKATNTELYKEQAAELNICLDLDYCCIVSELICQKASVPDDTSYPSMPQINLYIDLEQQIIFLLKQTRLHYMLARKNNFFVIYIETAASIRQIIQTLLSRIKGILSDSFPGYTFCHGIYLYDTNEKADHPQCYKRAKQALSYCKNNPAQCNGIFFYENTAKNILFTALKNDIFVCELCRSVMKGLLKEEDAFNRELLLTLSQYIHCNYNKNETARELNLHRQSLIYRLKKIEELTGLSLNDHDSLYLLESCLRLLRLI